MADNELKISVFVVRNLVDTAERLGVRRDELLRIAKVAPSAIEDLSARIPAAHYARLWSVLERLSGDPAIGIRVAEQIPLQGFGVFQYLAQHSENLGGGFRRVCSFWNLLTDAAEVDFHEGEKHARFTHWQLPGIEHTGRVQEYSLACMVVFGRRASGVDWKPSRVTFPHAPPSDTSAHERLFGMPVEFNSWAAALVFDSELTSLPMLKADENLMAVLDRHTADLMKALPTTPFSRRVRETIRRTFPVGVPTLTEMAKSLGGSVRTLQRQLDNEGTTYRKLVEEVRFQLASSFLRAPAVPIPEIPRLLGYSEPSAFYRAFRRWSEFTPAEFRERHS